MTPHLERIPREIAALADYEPYARARLDDNAWAYLAGAAADGLTQGWNREAFDALALRPRHLGGGPVGSTAIDLLGRRLPHPILLAPVAYHRLCHPDGERATAMAAAAVEAVLVAATLSSVRLEEIATAGEGAPQWFQLYLQADRGVTRALVQRAEAAGYAAIVLTLDAALSGIRNAEQRAGFRLPHGIEAANLAGMPAFQIAAGDDPVFALARAHAATPDEVSWLKKTTRLPVILKGILHPADAEAAIALGADAIVVSNHGGRTLDTLPAAITALPPIAEAVAGRIPILLDGGVRRGTDVLKALALGAHAVLIGRPYMMALAAAGPLGVAHAVKLLLDELAVAMVLTGSHDLARLPVDLVQPRA